MKKSVKGIIGLSAAVVVLGGGLAVLKMTEPGSGEAQESSTSDESSEEYGSGKILVYDYNSEDHEGVVKEAFVTNNDSSLHVIMNTAPTDDSAATYTLDGFTDLPVNTSLVSTLVNNAKNMVTNAIIEENCTDISKFGFDSPQADVTIVYESGSTTEFLVGDVAPANSSTYVMLKGGDTVYTIQTSYLSNYTKNTEDFINTVILEEPDEENYPIVNSLRIERQDLDYNILLEYDNKSDDENYTGGTTATHIMTEPTVAYLAVEKSTDITNGMFGLKSTGFYALHCKESDIAESGLKDPFCTVTMSCGNGEEYVLLLSEPFTDENNKKSCYAMMKDGNIIYTVDTETAKWAEVMPIDISSRIIIGSFVWNISQLNVSAGEIQENFTIKLKDDTQNRSSASTEDMTVTRNGEVYDAERFRLFYSFLIDAYAEEFALDAEIPDADPIASVTYTDSYTNETFTLDFYRSSALTSLIVINGEPKYYCAKSYVDTLVGNIQKIETGEDYIKTWK